MIIESCQFISELYSLEKHIVVVVVVTLRDGVVVVTLCDGVVVVVTLRDRVGTLGSLCGFRGGVGQLEFTGKTHCCRSVGCAYRPAVSVLFLLWFQRLS